MASEGPSESSIGFFEGLQLKFSDYMHGISVEKRLEMGLKEGNFAMIEWCVKQGADLNDPYWDPNGTSFYREREKSFTPFQYALFCCSMRYRGSRENIEKLISLGADVHRPCYNRPGYTTLLHHDVDMSYDNQNVIEILAERGVDLDKMEKGHTALWYAASIGGRGIESVKALIQAGVDINKKGRWTIDHKFPPCTPIEAAKRWGTKEIVQLLREAGAIEPKASPAASSSSSAITPSASIAASRKKAPAKHARKEAPVKETASKRARKK